MAEVIEMDYTQFSGTGYVDTGYYITSANNNNTIIELEVAFMGGDALFGFNRRRGEHNEHVLMGFYNGKAAFRWGSSVITYGESLVVGKYYKMRINTITKEFSVDGNVISGGVFNNLVGSNKIRLGVFFNLGNPTTYEIGGINVKSLVINVDGEDVINIKPASIDNNVNGIFDSVSGTFLMNANSVGTVESRDFLMDYTLINGVRNNSSAYIDTGVVISSPTTQSFSMELDIQYHSVTYWSVNGSSIGNSAWLGVSDTGYFCIGAQRWDNASDFQWNTNRNMLKGEWAPTTSKLYLNDTLVRNVTGTTTATPIMKQFLFDGNNNTANDRGHWYSNATIYGCKIIVDEILVRDFIPVRRNSDNEIGLFDKVENKFYGSATGVKLIEV